MPIFGQPDFQGDVDSLLARLQGGAQPTPPTFGAGPGMPNSPTPPWIQSPLNFLMSALQGQGATPAATPTDIMGGLSRGAPTGPTVPGFVPPSVNANPGAPGPSISPLPMQNPTLAGVIPTPPRPPTPAAPAEPVEQSLPFRDPMTGLTLGGEGDIPAAGPTEKQSPFERDLRNLVGEPSKKFGESTTAAKSAIEKYFSEPPGSAAGFGDWSQPAEATATVLGGPAPPFNKGMPAKSGPAGTTAGGGQVQVPAGGTAGPAARIKISPQEKELMVRTVLGEAADEPQKGKEAVAHVIINRALATTASGQPEFGPNVEAIIRAQKQFEPWNTRAGQARMYGYPKDSKDYKDAEKAVDDAVGGKADPTKGATYFYAPVAQAALGRAAPNWGTKDRFAGAIGGHNFYYGTSGKPLPPPEGATTGEVTEPPTSAMASAEEPSGRVTPQPPQYPMPPAQRQTPATDYSAVRAMLDKGGYITPGEHTANVLAGLARGAGSIASNAPGSFAAALAAAGAGGESAVAESLRAGRGAITQRAKEEVPLLGTEREQAKDYTQVEFQNAAARYKTTVENLNNDFTGRKQEFTWLQPDIKFDANGMHVTRYNPDTGQMEVSNVPLRDKVQQYEQLSSMMKALGADHPYVRMKVGQMQLDDMPEEMRAAYVKQLAVQDVISSGAGGTVFKEAWTKALKQAEKQIPAALQSKPEAYDAERTAIAKAIILNDPSINNPSWLKDAAAAGSPWAAWMLQNMQPRKATPQQVEAQDAGY